MPDIYRAIRPLLFALPAETGQHLALAALSAMARFPALCAALRRLCDHPALNSPVKVMGLEFPNAVGLAAGADKHGAAGAAFASLGLGCVEQGTVTPRPQPGNPRPRLFRLPQHDALLNRMGFNSVGLDRFIANIARAPLPGGCVRGINIGKNAATPAARAAQDYVIGLRRVYEHADYVAVNISSPNTAGLRDLQREEALEPLLAALTAERRRLRERRGRHVPLVVKVSPDLETAQVDAIAGLLRRHGIDGVAATNTTVSRPGLSPQSDRHAAEAGGLSGRPLAALATATIDQLHRNLQGEIPIIGIGGITDAASAVEKRQAGAALVQIYTGLTYRGPALIREIAGALVNQPVKQPASPSAGQSTCAAASDRPGRALPAVENRAPPAT